MLHEFEPIERICWDTNGSFYRQQEASNAPRKNTFHEYDPIERTRWDTNESFYQLQKVLNTSHKNNQRAGKVESNTNTTEY